MTTRSPRGYEPYLLYPVAAVKLLQKIDGAKDKKLQDVTSQLHAALRSREKQGGDIDGKGAAAGVPEDEPSAEVQLLPNQERSFGAAAADPGHEQSIVLEGTKQPTVQEKIKLPLPSAMPHNGLQGSGATSSFPVLHSDLKANESYPFYVGMYYN